MKAFFRVENKWLIKFLRKLGIEMEAYEIDKSVFDWEEDNKEEDELLDRIEEYCKQSNKAFKEWTKEWKQKPKKIKRLHWCEYGFPDRVSELKHKQDEIIDRINEL